MSGRGRGVRRRMGRAVENQGQREGRGMRSAVDPAPANKQLARRRRRNAAEMAQVPEPAPVPVPGPEPEVSPAKRRRADESAATGEVIAFCDISHTADELPCGHNVGEHEVLACYANDNLPTSSLSRIDNVQSISI
ncbi:hypothetical protein DPMN_177601 [Dreissena polymorpha]|uniref:Uncharacterized protein n=1 Tax=Dreissena polymorpha TaxID=45954 RepID=A0A9D4E923_DREPO|nr:hypothetical protein DPMN_177601 [Dreissena polymorpha]